MITHQLAAVDEVLCALSALQRHISTLAASLATCSFGAWEGQAANAAREERAQIVARMQTTQDLLSTAEEKFEAHHDELVSLALATH